MRVTQNEEQPPDISHAIDSIPRIGVTMGDPAGIGPEIVIKGLADRELFRVCKPIIIGDLRHLRQTNDKLGCDIEFVRYSEPNAESSARSIEVVDCLNLSDTIDLGKASGSTGRASAEYIGSAVELWKRGEIDAITTAPINKEALQMGGFDFPGHTEFLAELTQSEKFAMSFFAGKLCVVLLSTHVALRDALDLVKKDRLVSLIKFANEQLSKLIGRKPKLAIAGLNPHASENGMFGNEEAEEIIPAIETCDRDFGINVFGPFSPDTIFLRGYNGDFDAVIACYHDQATIAVKCLSFGESVNVTLGLPLIRTSVDHGTAFDIAGKDSADPSSIKAAIRLAAKFVRIRKSL